MSDTSPAERALDVLARIVKRSSVGQAGGPTLRSRYANYPAALYHEAVAALASQAAQPSEADGWVMVPREPTQEMREAATELPIDTGRGHNTALNWEETAAVWSSMIAATPKSPATDVEADGCNCGIGDQSDIGHYHESWCAALATPPAPNDDLRAALRDARTTLSITRTNIMCEMQKGEGTAYRVDGVPEELKKRIDAIDAALKENRRG